MSARRRLQAGEVAEDGVLRIVLPRPLEVWLRKRRVQAHGVHQHLVAGATVVMRTDRDTLMTREVVGWLIP